MIDNENGNYGSCVNRRLKYIKGKLSIVERFLQVIQITGNAKEKRLRCSDWVIEE